MLFLDKELYKLEKHLAEGCVHWVKFDFLHNCWHTHLDKGMHKYNCAAVKNKYFDKYFQNICFTHVSATLLEYIGSLQLAKVENNKWLYRELCLWDLRTKGCRPDIVMQCVFRPAAKGLFVTEFLYK
jgi:hypothetical protein